MLNILKKMFLGFLLTLSYKSFLFAAPKVVITLKPIHSLVASIMQGVGTPQLLLPDYASPHTFQLKPSNLKQLQDADLIIWIGPQLENFLEKPLSSFKPSMGVLALSDIPTLTRLDQRTGRNWQDSHDETHDHHHSALDPHIWLSPDNAEKMVLAIADYLAKKDPTHAKQYHQNAKNTQNALKDLKKQLQTTLSPVQKEPFLVYHDGYQYFEKAFHLNGIGTMVINPHLPLSANGLKTIQTLIADNKVRCVFRETEFSDNAIYNSLQNMHIKVAELDPLGARQEKGPKAYEKTMLAIGETMRACLSH